ncbi:MAG: four helix bundle protein [Bacteroidia bacterium]|jgi:four helix bundle protein
MSSIKSFEDLECWKAARDVRIFISKIIAKLPLQEKYDLIDNMRRASRSCTRNIAEGFGRFHYQENIQFCRISRGSMTELIDDLITCTDEKYISTEQLLTGRQTIQKAMALLNGYITYLDKAKSSYPKSVSEPETDYNSSTDQNNR